MTWIAKLRTLLRRPTPQTLDLTVPTVTAESVTEKAATDRMQSGSETSEYTTSSTPGGPALEQPDWTRRYKFLRNLGRGGWAKTVLAERRSDSQLVCLKLYGGRNDLRAAEQECRALMRLRHPSIVSLLDFSLDDKPPWLAMEYAKGSTLQEYLKQHGPLPPRAAIDILKPALEALYHAHSHGVIHRDLKPANLMIDMADGQLSIKILDFGIAIVDRLDWQGYETGIGHPAGTSLYMAPEQVQGAVVTVSCDLYAVGFVAWEMLMGRPAYDPRKGLAALLLEKAKRADRFTLECAPAHIPTPLREFIERCTDPDPRVRPTAHEGLVVMKGLEQISDAGSVDDTPRCN